MGWITKGQVSVCKSASINTYSAINRSGTDQQPQSTNLLIYAVWRVLRWLLSSAENQDPICCNDNLDALDTALGYYCFGSKFSYKGRTPTYTSCVEVKDKDLAKLQDEDSSEIAHCHSLGDLSL